MTTRPDDKLRLDGDKEEAQMRACALEGDCQELYQSYQSRYHVNRRHDDATDNIQERQRRFQQTVQYIYEVNKRSSHRGDDDRDMQRPQYHLSINRFADEPPRFANTRHNSKWLEEDSPAWFDTIFGGDNGDNDDHHQRAQQSTSGLPKEPQHLRSLQLADEQQALSPNDSRSPVFVRLESERDIQDLVGRRGAVVDLQGKIYYPKPAKKQKSAKKAKKNKHKQKDQNNKLHAGSTVVIDETLLVSPVDYKLGLDVADLDPKYPFGGSLPQLEEEELGEEINLKAQKSLRSGAYYHEKFETSLNWASRHNPDKVPLVHPVFDQGSCGSCWAYAATGSLETSLARRAARKAYWMVQNSNVTLGSNSINATTNVTNDDSVSAPTTAVNVSSSSTVSSEYAFEYARTVEQEVFDQTRLSIQELLDCDTTIDQGCIGGNPLLAFYYIHKYGLTSWQDYPYQGTQANTCRRQAGEIASLVRPMSLSMSETTSGNETEDPYYQLPMATVDSWGILPKNHEDLIQVALRFIGPVAVAINAADPDFISYGGGIFDKESCDQEANHAVLIVGYGEEVEPVFDFSFEDNAHSSSGHAAFKAAPLTRKVRYWIARNSWGTDWGEHGYIRIKRGPGGKKIPGICGIARSPSVALGGRVLFSPWSKDIDNYADAWDAIAEAQKERERRDAASAAAANSTLKNLDDLYRVIDNEWPVFCDKISPPNTFVHVGCRRMVNVFDDHRAASLGAMSLLVACCLAWPLTYTCRRRHERRKRLRSFLLQRQQTQESQQQGAKGDGVNGNHSQDHPPPPAENGTDDDEDDADDSDGDEHDPSRGSLSLSSDEDHNHHEFAILEDDLEVVHERTPMLGGIVTSPYNPDDHRRYLQQGSNSNNKYGTAGSAGGSGQEDPEEGDGGDEGSNSYKRHNSREMATPSSSASNEISASYLSSKSTGSGRSWFFMPK